MKSAFPHAEALAVAEELKTVLSGYCERIEICGSLRRRKPIVHDIEILYAPKTIKVPDDLFGATKFEDPSELMVQTLLDRGLLAKRKNSAGHEAWGDLNKLAVHVPSGISVDLFKTTPGKWWNSLVCRTGGKDNNLLITRTALAKGWHFEAYGEGFHRSDKSEYYVTSSERDVFDFLQLSYKEPWERL